MNTHDTCHICVFRGGTSASACFAATVDRPCNPPFPSPPVISIFAKMYSKSRRAEGLVLQSLRLSTEFNYVELVTKWKNIKYVVCAKISSTFVMTNEYPTDIAFVTQSARLKSMDFRGLHARYEEKLYSFRREISFARVNIMEIMEFWRVLYLDGEKEYL